MIQNNFDKFNILYIDVKEEIYYRVYDGCNSNIDVLMMNLTIAQEYMSTKNVYWKQFNFERKNLNWQKSKQ